jgi:hypothetical protein
MITIFLKVALLPLLVLSTSGRGIGWLICYIASSAVALYPDFFTSPSLSLRFLLQQDKSERATYSPYDQEWEWLIALSTSWW